MKLKLFAIAAMAAAVGFTACQKEKAGTAAVENGKATSMKVSLTFPTKTTRATADPNATDDEATVNTVDVFIYTAGGSYSSAAHLTAADFTPSGSTADADTYTATTMIPTTTGTKSVFVGINLPSAVVASIKSSPESGLYSAVQTMSKADLATAGNFVMFSVAPVTSTFVADVNDPANNLTIRCQRLVAKVTVETSATMAQDGVPGTLGDLTFAINNFNTKLFMMQGAAPSLEDPNWASGSYVAGDFTDAAATAYLPILSRAAIASPVLTDYSPDYAAENTSQDKLRKEITRATVRASFIPQNITAFTNGTDNSAGYTTTDDFGGVSTPATFYAVTPSVAEGTFYFTSQGAANTFAADNGGATVITYTDGLCYWNIYLNKTPVNQVNLWDVLRNDYYKCNITRIVTPGSPTPNVNNPDLPPAVDTDIFTDIEIAFWNTPIQSDYELGN